MQNESDKTNVICNDHKSDGIPAYIQHVETEEGGRHGIEKCKNGVYIW